MRVRVRDPVTQKINESSFENSVHVHTSVIFLSHVMATLPLLYIQLFTVK